MTTKHHIVSGLVVSHLSTKGYIMDNQLSADCARFIADYVNELVTQGKTIDKFAIMGALVAYYGFDDIGDMA